MSVTGLGTTDLVLPTYCLLRQSDCHMWYDILFKTAIQKYATKSSKLDGLIVTVLSMIVIYATCIMQVSIDFDYLVYTLIY